jgi:cytochrome P450
MSAALNGAPTMDVDFNAPEIIADPWPVLKQIREAGPVVWNQRGHWMTAHDWICRDVLNRPGSLGQEGSMKAFFGAEAFISIDEKLRHDDLRGVWMTAFTRKALEELARVIRRFCDELLDKAENELAAKGSVELGAVYCRPLPTLVIAYMMGVSEDMLSTVIEWSDLMGNAAAGGFPIDYDNDPHWLAAEKAKHELAGYLYEQIKYRRAHPGGTDLISQIVHSDVGKTLSEEAIMVNTRQLLFAGNETTARWLGHILVILGRNPALRRELIEQPALMPQALNEFMRWEPIVHTLPRGVVQEGIEVAGVPLPKGSELVMMLGGANRDPARYDDPERLDIHRERKANLGFGFGLHSCLGVTLSQLEAQIAVTALLARFPDFTIREPIVYSMLPLRGPVEVHVSIG